MDFNQIRYFLALADTLNFTSAAERCHVSQPGLTSAIRKLEDELGGPLIHRDGRNTRLTELGRTLRGEFENIDTIRQQIRTVAKLFRSGKTEELNVGLMCTIGPRVLSRFLDTFQEEHPNITVLLHDVAPSAIPNLLKSGAIDLAFSGMHDGRQPTLEYHPLFEEEIVVAFPNDHPFSERNEVALIDVAHERYVDRLHCEFRSTFLSYAEAHGVELDIAFSCAREDWIQDMIERGAGVSVIPRHSVLTHRISFRPIVDPVMTRQVEIAVARHGERKPCIDALIRRATAYDWNSDGIG